MLIILHLATPTCPTSFMVEIQRITNFQIREFSTQVNEKRDCHIRHTHASNPNL